MLGNIIKTRNRLTDAARWIVLSAAGGMLIAAGIVMFFTPGPGLGAIVLGLYVWGKQFRWAGRVLDRVAAQAEARRERLPAFVGRLLDERQRRRRIQAIAAEHAKPAKLRAPEPVPDDDQSPSGR